MGHWGAVPALALLLEWTGTGVAHCVELCFAALATLFSMIQFMASIWAMVSPVRYAHHPVEFPDTGVASNGWPYLLE